MDKKLCVLKDFVTTLWEIKAIDEHKYGLLAEKLATVGKMIGGFVNKKIKKEIGTAGQNP